MGCAEGQSPFAGSLRVSLRYSFSPSWYRKESEEGQEEFFRSLLGIQTCARESPWVCPFWEAPPGPKGHICNDRIYANRSARPHRA